MRILLIIMACFVVPFVIPAQDQVRGVIKVKKHKTLYVQTDFKYSRVGDDKRTTSKEKRQDIRFVPASDSAGSAFNFNTFFETQLKFKFKDSLYHIDTVRLNFYIVNNQTREIGRSESLAYKDRYKNIDNDYRNLYNECYDLVMAVGKWKDVSPPVIYEKDKSMVTRCILEVIVSNFPISKDQDIIER